jgi:hypothetical protein
MKQLLHAADGSGKWDVKRDGLPGAHRIAGAAGDGLSVRAPPLYIASALRVLVGIQEAPSLRRCVT